MGVKTLQTLSLVADGSKGEAEGGDEFTFSEAGEHVLIFTALNMLNATGPQAKAETRIGRWTTVNDTGISEAPFIELHNAVKVGVGLRATDAFAAGIALALIFEQ
nr:hypothetical protein [Ktedonobacteraceae bacterium]